ncbi:MAG: M16 family metallopeptidase [Alphaproteobacteria bacterium]
MTVQLTKIENGLTVVTDVMPHLETAALGLWVNCGARQESERVMGVAHMLEHMAFKGTARRTAKQIAEEIEAVGGDLNAYTGREVTAYHARVLKSDVALAADIISDILLNPAFDETELARERHVVIQEIGQTRDTPDDLIFEYLQEVCFPDQPMGWPILGTESTVSGLTPGHLRNFMAANYFSDEMIFAAAGAVTHEQIVDLARRHFLNFSKGTALSPKLAHFAGGEKRENGNLEQAHLAFAFPGVASADPDIFTAQVFATALGGGMSSRLFQEAREKRGLCYAIYAFLHTFRDCGVIGVYAGTSERDAGEIAPIVAGEMSAMASSATEKEVSRARAQIKASLLVALEAPHLRCEQMTGQLFVFGRILSLEELIARIDAVDAAAVRRFAERICTNGAPAMAAIGPVKQLETRDAFAARFGRVIAA